jgi:Cys-rich protein (TIGR01571 family)
MITSSPSSVTHAFKTGLYDCCADCELCYHTFACPLIQTSKNFANSRGESCTWVHCVTCPCNIWTRSNIRRARGMPQNYVGDSCLYLWCLACAACQDAREIADITAVARQDVVSSRLSAAYASSYVGSHWPPLLQPYPTPLVGAIPATPPYPLQNPEAYAYGIPPTEPLTETL